MTAAGVSRSLEIAEVLGGDDVEAADHGAPGRVVRDARDAEPGGRIDDAEIDAELVEPVVEQARHHRRGAVERVGRLAAPSSLPWRRRCLRRSAIDIDSDVGDRPHRLRKPSAALSPPTLRIFSLNTGLYSTQWPSPSMIGWSIFERTCSGSYARS